MILNPAPSEDVRFDDPTVNPAMRKFAVGLLIVGVVFLQRFALPLSQFHLPVCVFTTFVAVYILIWAGGVRINFMRLCFYIVAVAAMIVTVFTVRHGFSPFSFIYLVGLYAIYVFTIDVDDAHFRSYLTIYQRCLVVLACIAIAQFAEQLVLGTRLSLFDLFPKEYLLPGYNTRPTLGYGSTFYKSNADFFLEPSFVSQFMAIGIIIELLFLGSFKRMILFGVAIFTSFSGTGMVLLLLFGFAAIIRAKRFEILLLIPVGLVLLVLLGDNPYVQAITGRITEYENQYTSGFERFVGPNRAVQDLIFGDFGKFMFGVGPGVVENLVASLHYPAIFPVVHKLLIEYGLVGTVPFMLFVTHSFFALSRSKLLSAALFIMYLFLSGSLLQPHTVYLFYALVMLMPRVVFAEDVVPGRWTAPAPVPGAAR